MDIKRNILFFPDKEPTGEKDSNGNKIYKPDAKIRLRIRWDKKTVNFNVGHRVILDNWIPDTQRCKRNTTNLKKTAASVINNHLQTLENKVDTVFKSFEVSNTIPTPDQFRDAFNKAINKPKKIKNLSVNLFYYFDEFTDEMGKQNNWTESTFEKFRTVKSHLKSFDENLTFEKLTEQGLNDYIIYLRDEKHLRNSTIKKQLGFLKWFLRWAYNKEYNKNNAFTIFRPKLKTAKKRIVFLHWDELMTVYNKVIPEDKKHLDRVRDVFCFCCFTSLRYSDVENLKKTDIHKNFIEVTTVKTSDSLQIDLNNYSRAIIEKYKDFEHPENKAFPVISNQKMNDYLKDLGEFCELNRVISETYYKGNERFDDVQPLKDLISTHAGRRTFISNALMLGIPAEIVMKWSGHSDYKAMKPYIEIADKMKRESMNLFNK